ncbi:MAG: TIGR02300 family protein [Gemmataceae bacterium]
MSKPEWGLKRVCPNCGTRYYDMHHDPIVCPKCGTAFDAEAVVKTRRVRVQAVSETVIGPVATEEVDPELVMEGEETQDALSLEEGGQEEGDDEDAEKEEVLEDASELGEDEDDMTEVIENVDEEDDR